MSLDKIEKTLAAQLTEFESIGISKGKEKVITGYRAAAGGFGPRYFLQGFGDRAFLKMNSNSYLGLAIDREVIEAEAAAAERFGAGPGAVRFISGTCRPHVDLEKKLASFHGRDEAMIVSSAYATVMGVLSRFISEDTLVVSDELNHNCIINAIRLAKPAKKEVYGHLDMTQLEKALQNGQGKFKRACVVTDGIFSMRGDHAPLDAVAGICSEYDGAYEEGVISFVDDSHGVGAFGDSGRGTEEYTGARADVLIATLGKAFGVNGGYVVSSGPVIDYLRETNPFYIYSNPITAAEAAAAAKSLSVVDSPRGRRMLQDLRGLSAKLRNGLVHLGLETLAGEHPIVPILVRDTERTTALANHLFANDVLVTGLNYPVVPKGEEEIRLQVSADHSERDVEYLLDVLERFH
ncbi:MAG: aminotransferase class I/II-fold pyridoxal phosphate-dependent enzyme [Gammaproteobacteria bacterium]